MVVMEIMKLDRETYSRNLKNFLALKIKEQYEKPFDLVKEAKGELSEALIYRLYQKETEANLTSFNIIKISKYLGMNIIEFYVEFEKFIYKSSFMEKNIDK